MCASLKISKVHNKLDEILPIDDFATQRPIIAYALSFDSFKTPSVFHLSLSLSFIIIFANEFNHEYYCNVRYFSHSSDQEDVQFWRNSLSIGSIVGIEAGQTIGSARDEWRNHSKVYLNLNNIKVSIRKRWRKYEQRIRCLILIFGWSVIEWDV